jgi:hypothetical protein
MGPVWPPHRVWSRPITERSIQSRGTGSIATELDCHARYQQAPGGTREARHDVVIVSLSDLGLVAESATDYRPVRRWRIAECQLDRLIRAELCALGDEAIRGFAPEPRANDVSRVGKVKDTDR